MRLPLRIIVTPTQALLLCTFFLFHVLFLSLLRGGQKGTEEEGQRVGLG